MFAVVYDECYHAQALRGANEGRILAAVPILRILMAEVRAFYGG